jgi:alkylation response protein AidB-like acyl-CoA dehydrogenase
VLDQGLISGDSVFAFATTEPDASSDLTPTALKTVATQTADGFVVNGRKRWITNSIVADWVCVLCRDGETDKATMLLVDMHTPGIQVGEPDLKMGHRSQITADIFFDNVVVPADHALGEPGRGLATGLASLAAGRLGIAAAGVGVAQAALDLAVARLRSRELFGRKLGEMQYWQYKLAERATELEAARAMYQKAAVRLDRGDRSGEPEASMAKSYATRLANDLARDALQIYGGYGFARRVSATGETYRLEEIYRDAKILEIFEGRQRGTAMGHRPPADRPRHHRLIDRPHRPVDHGRFASEGTRHRPTAGESRGAGLVPPATLSSRSSLGPLPKIVSGTNVPNRVPIGHEKGPQSVLWGPVSAVSEW